MAFTVGLRIPPGKGVPRICGHGVRNGYRIGHIVAFARGHVGYRSAARVRIIGEGELPYGRPLRVQHFVFGEGDVAAYRGAAAGLLRPMAEGEILAAKAHCVIGEHRLRGTHGYGHGVCVSCGRAIAKEAAVAVIGNGIPAVVLRILRRKHHVFGDYKGVRGNNGRAPAGMVVAGRGGHAGHRDYAAPQGAVANLELCLSGGQAAVLTRKERYGSYAAVVKQFDHRAVRRDGNVRPGAQELKARERFHKGRRVSHGADGDRCARFGVGLNVQAAAYGFKVVLHGICGGGVLRIGECNYYGRADCKHGRLLVLVWRKACAALKANSDLALYGADRQSRAGDRGFIAVLVEHPVGVAARHRVDEHDYVL